MIIAGILDPVWEAIQWAWDKFVEFLYSIWTAVLDILAWILQLVFDLFVDFVMLMLDFFASAIDTINETFPYLLNWGSVNNIMSVANYYLPIAEGFAMVSFLIFTRLSLFILKVILKTIPWIW